MVIKNLENKIRLVGIICTRFSRGMCHHQLVKYLDSPDDGLGCAEEGVCAGRQRAYPREPHDNGRNA